MKIRFSLIFPSVLTIIFFMLKITHVIKWDWVWIVSPVWMLWIFLMIIACIITMKNLDKK